MKKILFFFVFAVSFLSVPEAYTSIDVLIFSSHPGDETLCCGGTIIKEKQNNKKVKVVFLTNGCENGETSPLVCKKNRDVIVFSECLSSDKDIQTKSIKALNILGVKENDVIFLGYSELESFIPQQTPDGHLPSAKNYLFSLKNTNQRKNGRTIREDLIEDIKNLLREFKPKIIYLPHSLDSDTDHQITFRYVYSALEELSQEKKQRWIKSLDIFTYLVNFAIGERFIWPDKEETILKRPPSFSQTNEVSRDISNFKCLKKEALDIYKSGLKLERQKIFLESFIKDNELFWRLPKDRKTFLKQIREEWRNIAKSMVKNGYNVNFAPVVDAAYNIEDRNIDLIKKERIYSQDPRFVAQLASASINGMREGGVIPVIKHFPGLGRSLKDSHDWLPEIKASKKELYDKDIIPFRKLIKSNRDSFWVMVNHVVYPCLDKEPASLSWEIQSNLLRKKLGFKGIIVVDELLCMKAIKEYARINKIEAPYIGEIVVRAFMSGADFAIIYTYPDEAEKIIFTIIDKVKKAVLEGRIKEETINESVKRILKNKERFFNQPLVYLVEQMSMEEKICQKLIMDTFEYAEVFKKYNLGGLHIRNRKAIDKIKENSRIPFFIICQHEGGYIGDSQLNFSTRSAYSIGKEFELLTAKAGYRIDCALEKKEKPICSKPAEFLISFNQLTKEKQEEIIAALLGSIDILIESWSEMKQNAYAIPHPNTITPLVIDSQGKAGLLPFEDLSVDWVRMFSEYEAAWCAYGVFKQVFKSWVREYKPNADLEYLIDSLKELKDKLNKVEVEEDRSNIRILCLAAHPDDEDGQALVYFKKLFNCSTYILLATRGQGGENLIGPCLDKELGFIRTEEMERAAAILGVDQTYYLGKKDFGYCKDLKEALREWGEKDTLKKIVYFYRLIKPHIIITKHNLKNKDHCQHQAYAFLAEKAFDLSGNHEIYPEMLKQGLSAWEPLKFYQRTFAGENNNKAAVIDTGTIIPSENKSINQIAYKSLKEHLTQVEGDYEKKVPGKNKIYYQMAKFNSTVNNKKSDCFFDGIFSRHGLEKKGVFASSGMPGVKIIGNLKIGLVEKNKNTLFVTLKSLGYGFKKIDEKFLAEGNLSEFDTIVIGQRIDSHLSFNNRIDVRLSEFVKEGGNLLVFFVEYGIFPLNWRPYPLSSCFNPIVDENSPITLLIPSHPLFNVPNRINNNDFKGWVNNRGYSFPLNYSREYMELTSCFYPKGNLIKSGYLAAHYGKGSYICTSYSWHRQLREFHLGAYKNFANMLAYKVTKDAEK